MAKEKNEATSNLIQGTDSGEVTAKIKNILALDSGGKCCFPGCPKHLTLNGTNIGKCAHIIPRKVGGPREDWVTLLEDRRKHPNLIYVCGDHHDLIDDIASEAKYPAHELRRWKAEHEARVRASNLGGMPAALQSKLEEMLTAISDTVRNDTNISEKLFDRLINECRALLRRGYIDKADLLITQAEMLLDDFSGNESQKLDLKALRANLLWKQGKIPEAKQLYLGVLEARDHAVAMLDYIELCNAAPGPHDRASEFEEKVERVAAGHPRLELRKLFEQYRQQQRLSSPVIERQWAEDRWLNGSFYFVYALLLDLSSEYAQRDAFVDKWEELLPESPTPLLFRVIFSNHDFARRATATLREASAHLDFVRLQKERILGSEKDPLSSHDLISLLVEEIGVYKAVSNQSIANPHGLKNARDKLLTQVNRSYFDRHVDFQMTRALGTVLLNPDQWETFVGQIAVSEVQASTDILDLVILQGLRIQIGYSRLREVARSVSRPDLVSLIDAVEESGALEILDWLAVKQPVLRIILLDSLDNPALRLALVDQLELPPANETERQYFRLEALRANGQVSDALAFAKTIKLDEIIPDFIRLINHVAFKGNDYRLTIESGHKLLAIDGPDEYKAELFGKLAVAYSRSDDDLNAHKYALKALEKSEHLSDDNIHMLISLAASSLVALGRSDEVKTLSEQHFRRIAAAAELGLAFAEALLKAKVPDRSQLALSCLSEAYRSVAKTDERVYLGSLLSLNELWSRGVIKTESQEAVEANRFIKIEGIPDSWFYLGDKADAFDAVALDPDDARYKAIIGKVSGEEIDWPADKFSGGKNKKRIRFIRVVGGYFLARAHEVMVTGAERGDSGIWSVKVKDESGAFSLENIIKFHEEAFQPQRDAFDAYCKNPLPFSILAKFEGSFHQALSKICGEGKGFVRCNNGTAADIHEQIRVARQVADGQPYFIDSLAVFLFVEAEILSVVVERLPGIHIPTSVIKSLRDLAEALRDGTSSVGRMGMVQGKLRLSEPDKEYEARFHDRLIKAADMLDGLPGKLIGNTYADADANSERPPLEALLPSWAVDPFMLAREKGYPVIGDDALMFQAFTLQGAMPPVNASSLSLVRALYEKGIVSWEKYLQYFRLLSSYRYFLLPVSVDDMENAVLGPTQSGLVMFTPKHLDYFNFALTLSKEYGIADSLAVSIAASFFVRLLLRDDVPEAVAEDIFPRVIIGILAKRKSKVLGREIINICADAVNLNAVAGGLARRKLSILRKQVDRYASEFNPIIQSVPSLLKG